MANLTIRLSTSGQEFTANDVDFSQTTPQQIIDNMHGVLPEAGAGMTWRMLKGAQVVDQNVPLEELGFQDGDTAELMTKVAGAF